MAEGRWIRCDGCEKQQQKPVIDWLTVMSSDEMTMGFPVGPYDLHFCSFDCLLDWAAEAKEQWEGVVSSSGQ